MPISDIQLEDFLTETPYAREKILSRAASQSGKLCDFVARNGNLDTLKWLVSIGCPMGPAIEESAGHNEEVLEWIKSYKREKVKGGK